MEGVALANQVANPDSAKMGASKQVKTVITFDNGRSWKSLTAPEKDSEGHPYPCQVRLHIDGKICFQDDDCHLHLHSYTENKDPVNIFSSKSAVGLLIGVGNIGRHLQPYSVGNTFVSRDAGFSWSEVRKGPYLHEFSDHGALLVLADASSATDHIL